MKRRDAPYDATYMEAAIALARKSLPSPNPRVGAVLVKDGEIVGRGYHEKPGTPHAEVNAIADAGTAAKGADLYVTLEPCVHVGRTGPCVKAIEKAGIKRVFVGMADPDGRVDGRGIAYLRNAGIDVTSGVDEAHCKQLLAGYITHRTTGRPHISLKAAITLDGCIATSAHDSKWISSPESRKIAHALRADADAILVGVNTVLYDDPLLTVRDAEGPSPLRIVLDSKLRIPPTSKIVQSAKETAVIVAHTEDAPEAPREQLASVPGLTLLACSRNHKGDVDLSQLAHRLGEQGILSLLVEGGARVFSAFLEAALSDQLFLFISPKIIGQGIPFTTFPGAQKIADGLGLNVVEIRRIEDDIFYRATFRNPN